MTDWQLALVGVGISLVLQMLVASKWKLDRRLSLTGSILSSVVAAVPFMYFYQAVQAGLLSALGVAGQVGLAGILSATMTAIAFYRDPERVPPSGDNLVVAAADGVVTFVKTVDDQSAPLVRKSGRDYTLAELVGTDVVKEPVHVIAIEMNLFDVHVNRCPLGGRVKSITSIVGGYLSLGRDEAPFTNARVATLIENHALWTVVVQIASRLVRRVDCFLRVDEDVAAGQRLGVIRFGSLVVVILPRLEHLRIEVTPGERVWAGATVMARYDLTADAR